MINTIYWRSDFYALKMTIAFNESNNETICNSEYQEFGQSKTITALLTLFTILGFIANLITLVILVIHKKEFPNIGRTLLKNQAIADSLVCIMAVGFFLQKCQCTCLPLFQTI